MESDTSKVKRDNSLSDTYASLVEEVETSDALSLDGEDDEFDAEGKKKQKKKFIKYEFDPEIGEVVAQKRRKRKADEWEETDW